MIDCHGTIAKEYEQKGALDGMKLVDERIFSVAGVRALVAPHAAWERSKHGTWGRVGGWVAGGLGERVQKVLKMPQRQSCSH